MPIPTADPGSFDSTATPNCPLDLTPLVAVGDDAEGADARWECSVCGYVAIAS